MGDAGSGGSAAAGCRGRYHGALTQTRVPGSDEEQRYEDLIALLAAMEA